MRKKPKLTEKQKKTIKKMKEVRQIDSQNLRGIIKQKLEWAKNEKKKGETQLQSLKIQIARIDGIILFIQDLIIPVKEENK